MASFLVFTFVASSGDPTSGLYITPNVSGERIAEVPVVWLALAVQVLIVYIFVTVVALNFGTLIGDAIVTETVFSLDGMGL